MQYTRLYADEAGESHFEDVEVKFQEMDYAPPATPMGLSKMMKATQTGVFAGCYQLGRRCMASSRRKAVHGRCCGTVGGHGK